MRQGRKYPPIEGMPARRPVCVNCGKKFPPLTRTLHAPWTGNGLEQLLSRTFMGWDSYNGLFHSLNCALAFATRAHEAGYRL